VPRVGAAAPSPARCRWIDAAAMTRLAEAQPAPFCALSAMLGGTGLEIAAVLELRRHDVDLDRREVRARARRRGVPQAVRVARVADWAWRLVARHARALPPGARLFAGIDRRAADASHRAACEAEGITGYRVQDQRHSWAVRAVRAGMPAELVGRQLGLTGPARVLAVYGRFAPERAELDRWEQLATAQDAERGAREKVALGHALYHPVYQPRAADAPAARNASDASELEDTWTAPRRRLAGSAAPGDTGPRTLRH
jgi:integrase